MFKDPDTKVFFVNLDIAHLYIVEVKAGRIKNKTNLVLQLQNGTPDLKSDCTIKIALKKDAYPESFGFLAQKMSKRVTSGAHI